MEAADYRMAWVVYVMAGVILNLLFWRVLQRYLFRELAYVIQCVTLALIYTPWWVVEDQGPRVMAPALIVFLMDVITIEPTAGIRALIPLVLAVVVALLVSAVLIVNYRWRRRRSQEP